jgi:hypothetical protein
MISKNIAIYTILFLIILTFAGCSNIETNLDDTEITIENTEMRLVLGTDGTALSLIHKSTGQECLKKDVKAPVFTITQDMPYDNEIKLAYPAKSKTFASNSIEREENELVVGFELIDYVARIGLEIKDSYIGFRLKKLEYHMADFGDNRRTRIDELNFVQLPIKNRANFGEWLNVSWDDEIAINLLATDPFTRIDAEDLGGYKNFQAGGVSEVKLEGIGAALIVTEKATLLDHIDRVERDYGLPLGVESRKSEEYKNSYYELRNVTPHNIDEHIAFAKQGGFRQMVIYYPDFASSMGHFPWKPEYPNGLDDLNVITRKIEEAGIIPGFHIHYNKAEKNDAYVTPVPDPRLNLRQVFTLAEDLERGQTTVSVEENPAGITLERGRRLLRIGNEIVAYKSYTTTSPYQFLNCERGALGTSPVSRKAGELIGLLDVDTWPKFILFNQKTNIQQEMAGRVADIFDGAGFKFIYYDGAEDVPPPYWFNVSKAQLAVHDALEIKPIFSEGACKSHFSWHIITRGNAFDIFRPEVIKEATRKHPLAEAELISNDFTSIDFGWIGYLAPGEKTIGMQPDMLEFITSRAAGWDSIISLMGRLNHLRDHPRTPDNLDVIRRWEEVRISGFLSEEQKRNLQDSDQEHILLINEVGEFELLPYRQITNIANGSNDVRAFIFDRNNKTWVVYWHTSGEGSLELPVNADSMRLFEELGKEIQLQEINENISIPVGKRRYIQFKLSHEEVLDLFDHAILL